MKRTFFGKSVALMALVGALALLPATSEAAFIARICDTANCSGVLGVNYLEFSDGDNDGIISTGNQTLIGYELLFSTSQSKPFLTNGEMDLSYGATQKKGTTAPSGPVWLYAIDTDFVGPRNIHASIGGTNPNGGTTTALVCDGDSNSVDFGPCTSSGPFAGAFSDEFNHFATANLYALAIGVMIDLTNATGPATGDLHITVPEPASLVLFGLGLAGFAAYRRRRVAR
jgi:hypothetical protein